LPGRMCSEVGMRQYFLDIWDGKEEMPVVVRDPGDPLSPSA
jgi:hypothetical protein